MQESATPEQQIAHYAIEFIDARDVHIKAAPDQKEAAREAKRAKERALDKVVKSVARRASRPSTNNTVDL